MNYVCDSSNGTDLLDIILLCNCEQNVNLSQLIRTLFFTQAKIVTLTGIQYLGEGVCLRGL